MMPTINTIKSTIQAFRFQAKNLPPEAFLEREALRERLDEQGLETLEALILRDGPTRQLTALRQEIEDITVHLNAQHAQFFKELRNRVGRSPLPVQEFQQQLARYVNWPGCRNSREQDWLDRFLWHYLLPWPIPEPVLQRERDRVGYHPTPVGMIFDLCERMPVQADDVFYDIGAGLGHVVFLIHLLTGIQARGVEIEPAYWRYAGRLADELGLSSVTFLNADAREVNYTDGTLFFLYTPFQGALLRDVLQKIRRDTQSHPVRIYTLGPCTLQVAEHNWLQRLVGRPL